MPRGWVNLKPYLNWFLMYAYNTVMHGDKNRIWSPTKMSLNYWQRALEEAICLS